MLCGNKESVYTKFRVDKEVKEEWKFSKEKAVILTIQLTDHWYVQISLHTSAKKLKDSAKNYVIEIYVSQLFLCFAAGAPDVLR